MSISGHHAKCIEALQAIALLGDTGSNYYKARFGSTVPAGWTVASAMRELANDAIGDLPLSPMIVDVMPASCVAPSETRLTVVWKGPESHLDVGDVGKIVELPNHDNAFQRESDGTIHRICHDSGYIILAK